MNAAPVTPKPPPVNTTPLDERSRALRRVIVRTLERGGRGHVGSAFSLVEMLRVLYDDVLRFDAQQPRWAGRDRCVLSKGHGCLALYALLADKGFFPEAELWKFCKPDGMLGGTQNSAKCRALRLPLAASATGFPSASGLR